MFDGLLRRSCDRWWSAKRWMWKKESRQSNERRDNVEGLEGWMVRTGRQGDG